MPPRLTGPTVGQRPDVSRAPDPNAAMLPGQVVAGAGRVLGALDREIQRLDEIRVNEALADYATNVDTLLNDPKDGILSKRGTRAIEGLDPFRDKLSVGRGDMEARLGNARQRDLFRAQSERLVREADRRAVTYLDAETRRVDVENTERLNALDVRTAIELAGNEGEVSRILTEMRNRTVLFGDRNQMERETIAALVQTQTENVRLAQVEALAARNPEQAQSVLDGAIARGEIRAGQARDRVERTLQIARRDVVVNREAARILATTDNPTEQSELVKQLPIGEVRTAVRELVRGEQRAVKEAQDLSQEQAFDRLQRHVLNGGSLSDPSVAKDLAEISVTQTETLQRYTAAPTTDNAAWMEWYQLASDPEALANLSESEFRAKWSRLTTSHRNEAERDYRQAKSAPSGTTPTYVTPQTMIARAMRTLGGVDPFAPLSDIDPDKQQMVVQFEQAAAREIAALPVAKRNDPVEVQKVLDRMQLTFVREQASNPARLGNLQWGGRPTREERRGFQMTPSDTTGIFAGSTRIRLDQIPADSISSVDNILRANNVPVTDANREAAYTIQRFDLDGSRLLRWLNDNRR